MASDYLLEIDGIKGESQDKGHPETIEVSSFSWGATQPATHGSGGGGGGGKVSFQDVHFTSTVGKASTELALACAEGRHIPKAVLFVRKAGTDQHDYYVVTLEDVMISSYQSGGSAGSGVLPTDQFAINFTKIKYEYKVQDEKGKVKAGGTMTWNAKTNTK